MQSFKQHSPLTQSPLQTSRPLGHQNLRMYGHYGRQNSANALKPGVPGESLRQQEGTSDPDSGDHFQDALSDVPQNVLEGNKIENLMTPFLPRSRNQSYSNISRKDGVSSIHSAMEGVDTRKMGTDIHFLIDMPSPRFSSALGEDLNEDEEKNELIRCILSNSSVELKEALQVTLLDVTKIKDELGYNLLHLCAYTKSEKCLQVLFNHVLYRLENSKDQVLSEIQKRHTLKEWINERISLPDKNAHDFSQAVGDCGFTPLHYAAYKGNPIIIQMLVDFGANIYATNNQEMNMLHASAQGDQPYSISFFKRMGICINSRDQELATPLHWACISQSKVVIQFLLAWDAEINAQDASGLTPLHMAVKVADSKDDLSTIKKLIFKGANQDLPDFRGKTPLDYAQEISDSRIRKKVLELFGINSASFCQKLVQQKNVQEMKNNTAKVYQFLLYLIISQIVMYLVIYPNVESSYWRFCLSFFAVFTAIFFVLCCTINPGYMKKKGEEDFLILLQKFDPKSLCPFCEIIQNPSSQHCFACNRCVENFDHHCFWLNNCIGKNNQHLFIAFVSSSVGFLLTLIIVSFLNLSLDEAVMPGIAEDPRTGLLVFKGTSLLVIALSAVLLFPMVANLLGSLTMICGKRQLPWQKVVYGAKTTYDTESTVTISKLRPTSRASMESQHASFHGLSYI